MFVNPNSNDVYAEGPSKLVFSRKGSEVIQTVKRFDPDNLVEADA
jgi:hypothetical protein